MHNRPSVLVVAFLLGYLSSQLDGFTVGAYYCKADVDLTLILSRQPSICQIWHSSKNLQSFSQVRAAHSTLGQLISSETWHLGWFNWSKAKESLKLREAYQVEQDVGGLEVAVDHRRVGIMEKGKALGRADSDLHPCHPRERAIGT
uniref:Secreted protein n=1 Tax=Triticum urartu TaxID=4572 RepID=A0A8R7UJY0_TRIUA